MDQDRIKRGVFYCVICLVAGLAGFFVKKVLIGGGTFSLSTLEIAEVVVTGILVGIVVPGVEGKRKNSR